MVITRFVFEWFAGINLIYISDKCIYISSMSVTSNAKHAAKADIDENDIFQWLCIFRRLAAEWGQKAFVYDVIVNMAMATSVDARGDSQETSVKKMINGNVSLELNSLWFAGVYGAASSIQNCVSPPVLRLQKVQEC